VIVAVQQIFSIETRHKVQLRVGYNVWLTT